MGYNLTNQGIKWGSSAYGTPSGTIRWSGWSQNFGGEVFPFTGSLTTDMMREVQQAIDAWEAVANVSFTYTSDSSNLNTTGLRIGLGPGDGPGGTEGLAKRYSPTSDNTTKAAQIWLDSGEGWHLSNGKVIDSGGNSFYQVILHELGHVLGLAHFDGGLAVMNSAVNNLTQLTSGDIAGIQYIYGGRSTNIDLTSHIRSVEVDGRDGATIHEPGALSLVHYSVTNISSGSTPAGVVGFYLSTDADIGPSDRYLGSLTLSNVIGGHTQLDVATYVRLPSDVSPGDYYIGIMADENGSIVETNEGNNFSAGVPLTIGIGGLTPLSPQEAFGLARLYNAGFGRDFDAPGLNFWIDQAETGTPLPTIAGHFLDSSEFTQRFGDDDQMGNLQFVSVMYQNVLHRPGEASGIDFWVDAMNGGASRELVLMEFAKSPENIANTPEIETLVQTQPGYWDLA